MKDNLVVLMGPTAIGKTDLSVNVAKDLDGEIISADSMQIYKYMDIGTAKITQSEMQNIPHYLIDFIYPDEEYTVSNYQFDAKNLIHEINSRNKLPIVVGGTGLYINSLVYNLNFANVPPNEEIRKRYEDLANEYGNEYIYEKLKKIDLEGSQKIELADRKRIIRYLEIFELTGKTMSEHNKNFRKEVTDYNLAMICLNMDRSILYNRINDRVDLMIEKGLIGEVKKILDMGYKKNLISLQGIGYKEIISYLDGEMSLSEAIDKIKQGSRNYAKRQLTWFRRDKRIKWINIDEFQNNHELSIFVQEYINDIIDI
ncbi:tRNA (adenosine(37)-N6)-dimethylallyltransferase MiaA [Wansuia hejianensis]|uniref:tRNA dimethylallyltransferase n=1 Tax=Wansuia hejianensis TaxID=2763667 RepID=A0A926EZT5_9FIRM|nr:tRNA (adenosine(37)-N6)-dimethylallyltransferase MiaA [Wansuia hejianensis]MBC8590537.1 tRNA (adenosine(37)-N6)-dimethylallyltransferase MiaA [Wansuia hejianensis]